MSENVKVVYAIGYSGNTHFEVDTIYATKELAEEALALDDEDIYEVIPFRVYESLEES